MPLPFESRAEAGRLLATKLTRFQNVPDVLVLALPRGGVPVGVEVATALGAPLDVFVVRKLGVPGHEELAFGAIASGRVRVLNRDVVRSLRLSEDQIEAVAACEQEELERREKMYRAGRSAPDPAGRTLILVDDGLATGATMLAAARALRQKHPRELVVAVPVAAPQTCEEFRTEVDDVICLATPEPFQAVSLWYKDFAQTTDDEVRELMQRVAKQRVS